MKKNDELPRGVVWVKFLETFAASLGRGAIVVTPKCVVAWRDGSSLNHLDLLRWSWPDARFPHAPRVTRVSFNAHAFTPPKTLLRRLGFDEDEYPSGDHALRLEWTVLGDELLPFAEWLPFWIRGRLDPTASIPLPPHPSHVFGEDLRTTSYAWTATAWEAYARWQGQAPALPRYAIDARDVVPATSAAQSVCGT